LPLFTKIDSLTRPDHSHLTDADTCFFLRDYYARKGYSHNETNSIIHNLKKSPRLRGTPQWVYKERDILRVGIEMRNGIDPNWLKSACVVPMPPSKAKGDPEYDDRMVQIGRVICDGTGADLRELLLRRTSRPALHVQQLKRDIQRIYESFHVDTRLVLPKPNHIALVDDVLTTGASFVAACRLLRDHFPGIFIAGIFVARRVPTQD